MGTKRVMLKNVQEANTIQAHGDRAAADALLARLGDVRPAIRVILDRLAKVPVDVAPRFTTADALAE